MHEIELGHVHMNYNEGYKEEAGYIHDYKRDLMK